MAPTTGVFGSRNSSGSALSQIVSPNTKWRSEPHSQSQSGFFAKLPQEIRDQIYQDVIGSQEQPVRICRAYDSRKNYRLRLDVKPLKRNQTTARPSVRDIQLGIVGLNDHRRSPRCNPLAWLMSCQAIYVEAFSLLYFIPTISINDTCTFEAWGAALPSYSLSKLKTLRLDWVIPCITGYATDITHYSGSRYRGTPRHHALLLDTARWTTLWDTVAAMKGLKNLQVKLKSLAQKSFDEPETLEILEPINRLRKLPDLSVVVAWHLSKKFIEAHHENHTYVLICAPTSRES